MTDKSLAVSVVYCYFTQHVITFSLSCFEGNKCDDYCIISVRACYLMLLFKILKTMLPVLITGHHCECEADQKLLDSNLNRKTLHWDCLL